VVLDDGMVIATGDGLKKELTPSTIGECITSLGAQHQCVIILKRKRQHSTDHVHF
jgi:hypothetical protein